MDGTPIRIRRSAVPGKRPTVDQLLSAELAYNTYDGELTAKRDRPGIGADIIRIGSGTTVTNILYVTKDGNDTNTGLKLGDAKRTIGAALTAATTGSVIKVSAGSYIENNPLTIPEQVSVVGDSLREVSVSPQNPDKDLFYVANGVYVAEMSYTGTMNPGGAIFSFNPDQIGYFDQSPYIQNGTNFIPGSIGMRIDGSKALGPTKCMVLDSYTQYNQGGIGISITNEGYAQLVSLFTICSDIAVFCGTGAACDLTNSNSSFGTYGLVADGLGPLKYTGIVTGSPSSINDDTFAVDLNVPTLNITNALYDNRTGLLTAYTSAPHRFSVGMGITLSGLGFTCSFEPGTRFYPNGRNGYVFEAKTVAPGRYIDSYNLITANKQEIQDKSLAAIALNHPDFYFPGDAQTNARSRYYDSYRLIQQNKQEIIDKSLASIAVGFPSSFRFPDDPVPYDQNRYYDSSGLIQRNKQEIIDKSLAAVALGYDSYPTFYFPGDTETNSRSRYYDSYRLIQQNKQEIVDKSLAAVAIGYTAYAPFYFPGDTLTNARSRYYDAYRLIQKNKTEIVGTAWTNTYNVYPGISTTQTKCKRDIGFFIDAISADVFTGGNNYAKQFTLQYFDGAGSPISNGLVGEEVQSVYAFNQARDLMKSAITNQLTYKEVGISTGKATYDGGGSNIPNTSTGACADVQSNIDNLVGIVTTSIGAGNTSLLPSPTNLGISATNTCARDLGFLVDAISTDVFTGGNKYSREFVFQYANGGIANPELAPSLVAFSAARDYAKKAITNQLNRKDVGISSGPATYGGVGIAITVYSSGNPDSCTDVQENINTLVGIVTVGLGIGTGASTGFPQTTNLGTFTTGGAKCARDLGFLVDAISTDVFTGGNKYSREFVFQYYNGTSRTGIGTTELAPSLVAFSAARDYSKQAITNQLNQKNLGISSGPATYGGVGIAITAYPSGNPDSCTDVQSTINTLVGIVTVGVGIGTSVAAGFPQTANLGISTTNICARDLGYLVDAVSTDVFTGGNKYSRDFTNFYFNGAISVGIGTSERLQSVYSFNSLRDYCNKAITNQLNIKDVGISSGPAIYGGPGIAITVYSSGNPDSCTDVQQNINTLVEIVTNVIGSGSQSYLNTFSENSGTFTTGGSKCYRDIGYLVDAVSLDVRDYTNKNTRNFIKGYFNVNGDPLINGIVGEVAESISAFNGVRDYSKKAITNQLNGQDRTIVGDPTNTDPASCANVQTFIDNLIGTVTSNSVGVATTKLNLPAVSMGSTVFTVNVGVATQPHTYVPNTGTAKINIIRPFDGQIIYFDDLYYTVSKIVVGSGGTGYTENPTVTIADPDTSWGVTAQAVSNISNGSVTSFDIISSGRGYTTVPKVTISSPNVGINTATASAVLLQSYYPILSSTPISAGICTVTISENIPYVVAPGTEVPFYKQSRVLASGHSFEYIGSGTEIAKALPATGGVPIQDNEVDIRNGGLVVYTSTDQSGNFRIGEGIVVNQQTGTISGAFYTKSLFSTVTPFILALGG
jgi:hypothetical protein